MNCEEFQIKVPDHLKKDLDKRCEEHLSECEECRKEWETLVETWRLLRVLPLSEPGSGCTFEQRLEEETHRISQVPHPVLIRMTKHPWFLAATVLLVVTASFVTGVFLTKDHPAQDEMASLARRGTFALLRRDRVSERLTGVALLSQGSQREPDTAEALMGLLEKDPSPQVRLAALDALYLYGNQPEVAERLARSLPRQSDPEVQAAQAGLLLALREKRALEALRALLRDPALDPRLRRKLQAGMQGEL